MKSKTSSRSDRLATDVHAAVEGYSRGRQMHWMMVHDLAVRLGVEDNELQPAIRRGIEKGWLIEGDPPHSICLASRFSDALATIQ